MWKSHINGKQHASKKKFASKQKPVTFTRVDQPIQPSPLVSLESVDTSTESVNDEQSLPFQCNSLNCNRGFKLVSELVTHVKEIHGFLITCTSCIDMKWKPKEALNCEELIHHYDQDHKKTMTENDLKVNFRTLLMFEFIRSSMLINFSSMEK